MSDDPMSNQLQRRTAGRMALTASERRLLPAAAGHLLETASRPEPGRRTLDLIDRLRGEVVRLERAGAVDAEGLRERLEAVVRLRAALRLAGLRRDRRELLALARALESVSDLREMGPPPCSHVARHLTLAAGRRLAELARASAAWCHGPGRRLVRRIRRLRRSDLFEVRVRARLVRSVRRISIELELLQRLSGALA